MPLCCLPLYMFLPACRTSCTRLSVPRWTKGVEHKEEIVSNPRYIKKKIIEKSFRLLNERFCRISFRWGSVWEVHRSNNKHNRTTECFWCCYSCSSVWVDCLTDAGFSRRLQVSSADLSAQNLLIDCQTFVHVYISLNWMKTAPKHSHAFAVKQNRWMFVAGGVRRLAKRDQRCSENREICEIEKSIGLNRAKLRSIATHL